MALTVLQHIEKSKGTLFSFELLPPLKGHDFESTEQSIEPLLEFNPSFINITYHQQEVVYENAGQGLMRKHTVRKRPGTVGIAAAIKYRYGINVVPHIICGGFTKEDTENALIDLQFLGINNLLVVRGDPQPGAKVFVPEPNGNEHSSDLIEQIVNLNNGIYIDDKLENTRSMNFCIGVAGYPEKHSESPNIESDIHFLKKKIDAGASYIVTQMFYDNKKYFEFVKLCREKGINVPIIPGIKPLSTSSHLKNIPKTFNVDLPVDLVKEVIKCKDNKSVRQVGVEWSTQQSKELKAANVPVIHFYTMGNSDNIQKIAKAVF
ncbi:MAG: methylenetetrahydrofolate reductase [NAD(P)H] [Lentimicrobiaceae bacterium]|jgi:methylenetetrahydrofolate reductase (NADPH)|nr:methylenetetrahydrofolate reductase [NAD(P)H] [Lentimicrobiaceae bacterium]MCP4910433.1 methylenetetrahydrofolate reductase [NAD(P)H] [Bacteroidota bacterium]MBT3454569.1 methylenetetrahydrofolate reductase [NAD(P)H] [Lentimicrobiaceae bacterium]MBT3819584.1 methylenetetrahydrofolate reductase [NAD(P)H] [Lentimicrobiaceae bacterium]MBT4060933.1 methylenetetrahydrofolate reductase [NAD(P)H] [Lentimicrobiaceae bacterium]